MFKFRNNLKIVSSKQLKRYPFVKILKILFYYRKEDEKLNISWTEVEGIPAISYYKLSTYRFDPKLSIGDPKSDTITTANLPILVRNNCIFRVII